MDDVRLARALTEVVGAANVLSHPTDVAGHTCDWTGAFRGRTPMVVRPRSTPEVAGVVLACRESGHALVTQGGNTGLVGGGVPLQGEVVLSTRRLNAPPSVDLSSTQAQVWAGTPLQVLQDTAAEYDLRYGVDLASRGSATVGGNIATNAGGLRVMRFGDTRAQLVGVEAVLGTGAVVSHLSGLTRDNTGYSLPSLLAGSEGTLGVVTRAVVRLGPRVRDWAVGLLGFSGVASAVVAAQAVRRSGDGVCAVELMTRGGVDLVAEVSGRRPPLAGAEAFLLVETCGPGAAQALSEAVECLTGVLDGVLAETRASRQRLWAWRESHTECINTLGPPVKMDVTLPGESLADFVEVVGRTVGRAAPGARTFLFGHAADGNVHVNVTGALERAIAVQDAVFTLVGEYGGSISTEHGIGTAKRAWLHLVRSPEEIAAFRSIKAALDPAGILNPGVLLPPLQ